MSILSTLNKLTGKSDKSVLAALNSLTGKTADNIEEAVGNLSTGSGSAPTTLISFVHDPELDDIEEELTEDQISSLMSGICLYWGEDKTLNDLPCISIGGIEPSGAPLELPVGINVFCIYKPEHAWSGAPTGVVATVCEGTATPEHAMPVLSNVCVFNPSSGGSAFSTIGETMTLYVGFANSGGGSI